MVRNEQGLVVRAVRLAGQWGGISDEDQGAGEQWNRNCGQGVWCAGEGFGRETQEGAASGTVFQGTDFVFSQR